MIRVTVWNEGVHEVESPEIAAVYPHGIHGRIKSFLDTQEDIEVRTATLSDPDCGLPPEVLENTDVLIWWGHMAHDKVPDELVERVHDRVLRGMGFIALHSAHFSKPFKRLMGTSCALHWRDGDFERLWTVNPAHPIAKGIGEYVEIPVEEMYGERSLGGSAGDNRRDSLPPRARFARTGEKRARRISKILFIAKNIDFPNRNSI